MQKQIFVSYSRADTDFVNNLINDLIDQGLNVWLDQRNIGAGQRWDNTIQEALQSSDVFVIILSPSSVASENVLDELSYALSANKRIIPVLYRDCQIPYRIARVQFVDLRTDYQRGFRHLVSEITQQQPQRPITTRKQSPTRQRSIRWWGFAVAFILCVVLGMGGYFIYSYILPADVPSTQTSNLPAPGPSDAIPTTSSPPRETFTPTPTLPRPTETSTPTPTPQPTDTSTLTPIPPHAPEIDNTFGVPLYDEHQKLITLKPGEQYKLAVLDTWSAPQGADPSCASAFMALTWIVRDPYPTGGEDLQLLRSIPFGGGRTEVFASGVEGSTTLGYCDEIYLFNNSLRDYWVEIRYASGLYP
jgi:hypothetical protein